MFAVHGKGRSSQDDNSTTTTTTSTPSTSIARGSSSISENDALLQTTTNTSLIGLKRPRTALSSSLTSTTLPSPTSSSSRSPATTISIRNISVHFPFKPYDCQIAYMTKTMDALLSGGNALLESPTGTGKTLCLLCATLAWQQECVRRTSDGGNNNNSGDINAGGGGSNSSNARNLIFSNNGSRRRLGIVGSQSQSLSQQSNSQSNSQEKLQSQQNKAPTIIYASRTHSQLSQVVRELRSTRYRPRHTVLGSRDQLCIHPKVRGSSSGDNDTTTSKKGSSSASTTKSSVVKTSTEINHACAKLTKERKCHYRNNLDSFNTNTAGSGDFGGKVDPGSAIAGGRRNDSCGGSCGGNGGSGEIQPVMDIEDIISMGKKKKVCPFYLTRGHIEAADIIFLPYNYLFDKDARTSTLQDVNFTNSILIFDEAHNLESFASDSASFDLSCVDILEGCVHEVEKALMYVKKDPSLANRDGGNGGSGSGSGGVSVANLQRLKAILLRFGAHIRDTVRPQGGSLAGEYIFELLASGAGITYANNAVFLSFVSGVGELLMEARGVTDGGSSGGNPKLEHFASCLKKIFGGGSEGRCIARAKAYRVHITPRIGGGGGVGINNNGYNNTNNGRILSFWCFAPSLAMHELASLKIRSMVVTSGTLSPLPSYAFELGLPFPHILENPHVVTSEQVEVKVIPKGVGGRILSSAYGSRDDKAYISELGNTIVTLARVIPGGVLIFFPSYAVMENCIEGWGGPKSTRSQYRDGNRGGASGGRGGRAGGNFFERRGRGGRFGSRPGRGGSGGGKGRHCFPHIPNPASSATVATPWTRLLAVKAVVIEPRTAVELKDALSEFERYLSLPKNTGCVLMGVCRGKISEGIDFSDNKCRAVVITGLPFAPYQDPKVKLKREYLDGMRASSIIRPTGEGGFGGTGATGVTKATKNANGTNTSTGTKSTSAMNGLTLSGSEWYSQQAHRAVNQAVGRVIRHRHDYGAVLLLDSRFAEPRNQSGLSRWVRPYVKVDDRFGATIGSLVKFYKIAKQKVEETRVNVKTLEDGGTTSIRSKMSLQYEGGIEGYGWIGKEENANDASYEDMTNIAFIKKTDRHSHATIPAKRTPMLVTTTVTKKTHTVATKTAIDTKVSSSSISFPLNVNVATSSDVSPTTTFSKGGGDEGLSNGYIRPDRVISRVELKDVVQTRTASIKVPGNVKNAFQSKDDMDELQKSKEFRNLGLASIYDHSRRGSSRLALRPSVVGSATLSKTIASAFANVERGNNHVMSCERVGVRRKRQQRQVTVTSGDRPLGMLSLASSPLLEKCPKSRNEGARQFFELCRKEFSSNDFSKVRKILITLKVHGDASNQKAYMKASLELIELLLFYDPSKENSKTRGSDLNSSYVLLDLLYPLLPMAFRLDIEKAACKMRFELSALKQSCLLILSRDDNLTLILIFPKLMVDYTRSGYCNGAFGKVGINSDEKPVETMINRKAYLRETQIIIDIFCKYGSDEMALLLKLMYPLIPIRYRDSTVVLVKEMNLRKRKDNDLKRFGQNTSKNIQNQRSPGEYRINKTSFRTQNIRQDSNLLGNINMVRAIQKEKIKISNPYSTKNYENIHEQSTNTTLFTPQHSKRANTMLGIVRESNKKKPNIIKETRTHEHGEISSISQASPDPLDQCLKQVRSEVYTNTKQRSTGLKQLNLNLPHDFLCRICKEKATKPVIGKCGHTACFDCWTNWLKRSNTCPICRSMTTNESLSKVVFEKEAGSGAPTMTQMCANDDSSNDDEFSELEIIN